MAETAHDPVNRPAHYQGKGLEAIQVIEDWELGYHLGNAVKYILRAGRKGDRKQDLEKALWYVRRAQARRPSGVAGQIESADVSKAFDLPEEESAAIWFIRLAAARPGSWQVRLRLAADFLARAVERGTARTGGET